MSNPTETQNVASRMIKSCMMILVVLLLLIFAMFHNSQMTFRPSIIQVISKHMKFINFKENDTARNASSRVTPTINVTSSGSPACSNCGYLLTSEILEVFGDFKFQSPDCNNKFLVYECTGAYCGGLADREKGIISSFLLAILTNRTLVVDHRKPCELKKYLEPNHYDWSKCMPYVAAARTKSNFYTSYIDGHGNIANDFSNLKIDDIWSQQVATLHNINVLILNRVRTHPAARQKMPWLFTLPIEKQISGLWHTLFKPVSQIVVDRDKFIKDITKNGNLKMVGVHYREDFLKVERDAPVFMKFLEQYTDKDSFAIYVATDNEVVKKETKARFPNVSSIEPNVTKLHVDHGANCDGLYYAVLEQQLLSRSTILVISISGYAQYAAYIRGSYNNIFLLKYPASENSTSMFEKVGLETILQRAPPTR